MDSNLLAAAGISSSTMAILFIIYKVLQRVVGHRVISNCCGRRMEVGVDVRDMPSTPEGDTSVTAVETPLEAPPETSAPPPSRKSSQVMQGNRLKEVKEGDIGYGFHSPHTDSASDIRPPLPPLSKASNRSA